MNAEKLFAIFRGLHRAYGAYTIEGKDERGKATGKAKTIQAELTIEHWQAHLDGAQGIGVVPITDDGLCYFAAIDVDVYNLDLKQLEKNINKLQLPLIVCRTKSGGAHLYLLLKNGAPAKLIRRYLTQWAIALGFPGVEIFPKQDELTGPEDVGNWINMPYFDAERTTRYCIHNGKALSVDKFIKRCKGMSVELEDLEYVELTPPEEELKGAPPCLVTLAINGVPEGMRNNALYNFAVLAKQRKGEEFEDLLGEYNTKYMTPPLPFSEVAALVKSMKKKDYFYKCNEPPVSTCCNKELCRDCEYGIGSGNDPGVQIDELTKIDTDPPLWIIQIAGKRMQLETDDLLMQRRFGKKCVETINFLPRSLKPDEWKKLVNELLLDVHVVEPPPDADSRGLFVHHLEQFCTNRTPANQRDEILLGKPYHEEGRTYFRTADFVKYLEQQRFRGVGPNRIYTEMRERVDDLQHHFSRLRGKGVNYWSIPSFDEQIEEHEIPNMPEEEF